MRITACLVAGMMTAISVPTIVEAQVLKVVRPIPGYKCMMLNLTESDLNEQSMLPPVFVSPSLSSPRVGKAIGTVFVKTPEHEVDGFTEILHLSGREAWIESHYLVPWHPLEGHPRARCIPSLMSNGRPGFDIH